MKKIILHGLLKKMFCDSFVVKANSIKDIFKCMASNAIDYSFKMNSLLKQQYGLALVIDGVFYHDMEIDLDIWAIKIDDILQIRLSPNEISNIGLFIEDLNILNKEESK